jgi:DNA modification methylase
LGKLVPSRAGFNKRYFGKPSSEGNKQDALHEPMGEICAKCGAVRIDQQIGLEQTPDEYIANLVAVFRECKRILRDDGTLWVNIGDSYSGSGNGSGDYREDGASISKSDAKYGTHKPGTPNGLKPKDLIGIPWMLAFALRADGWYLRQDIIWHKPNPMPESVKDRCTRAHEYVFLLSKSPRYYYDYEAVLEPISDKSLKRAEYGWDCDRPSTKNASLGGDGIHTEKMGERFVNPKGRNRRSVWTVTTSPYKGAHYATFPPKLIEPMILAGCPAGGIVLDPFVGSGTTVMVANHLGRKGIGLDLNFKYLKDNAKERIATVQPIMFN